jgi:NDP-sugar pyrophosphorylase family protein
MGPLKLIPGLPKNVLVMNGDILTDLDFSNFYESHVTNNELFSIAAYTREQFVDYGVLCTDVSNNLIDFIEKPKNKFLVSMGIYMVNCEILPFIKEGVPYGFDNLMADLLMAKRQVKVKNYDGYWLDIGRPDDYAQAVEEFDIMKKRFIRG